MRISEQQHQELMEKRARWSRPTKTPEPPSHSIPPARAQLERLSIERIEPVAPARLELERLMAANDCSPRTTSKTTKPAKSPHAVAIKYLERHPEAYSKDREFFDQVFVFRHFELLQDSQIYHYLAAIPNGGQRLKGVAGKMRASGQKKGYPDITLDLARGCYHGLRIELKAKPDPATGYKGGVLQSSQIEYLNRLADAGYCCAVCFGTEEAIATIEAYCRLLDGQAMLTTTNEHLWRK